MTRYLEEDLDAGLDEGRVPTLSGRLLSSGPDGWTIGEQLTLVDAERSTGGDGARV